MLNLEGQPPEEGLDDTYIMLLRRANLDAIGGRAVATIEGRACTIARTVSICQKLRKTPSIPARGPMPLSNNIGMGLTVELLFHSITTVPRLKGESHIQYESVRRLRATSSSLWESSPAGTCEGSTFSSHMARITITSCPTQQKWFGLVMRGIESRMGYSTRRQQPLGIGVITKLLAMIREEAEDQEKTIGREYLKVGAAVATTVCASLCGSEVFMMELLVSNAKSGNTNNIKMLLDLMV